MQEAWTPWPPVVTFDFKNATQAQKEVLARENAHCSRYFQASLREWLEGERFVPLKFVEPK